MSPACLPAGSDFLKNRFRSTNNELASAIQVSDRRFLDLAVLPPMAWYLNCRYSLIPPFWFLNLTKPGLCYLTAVRQVIIIQHKLISCPACRQTGLPVGRQARNYLDAFPACRQTGNYYHGVCGSLRSLKCLWHFANTQNVIWNGGKEIKWWEGNQNFTWKAR